MHPIWFPEYSYISSSFRRPERRYWQFLNIAVEGKIAIHLTLSYQQESVWDYSSWSIYPTAHLLKQFWRDEIWPPWITGCFSIRLTFIFSWISQKVDAVSRKQVSWARCSIAMVVEFRVWDISLSHLTGTRWVKGRSLRIANASSNVALLQRNKFLGTDGQDQWLVVRRRPFGTPLTASPCHACNLLSRDRVLYEKWI